MILTQLEKRLKDLSKAERRIAEVILSDPESIVHATTAEVARKASVSDPMVSRLCRSMGCKGFPEFKVQLAQSLAQSLAAGTTLLTQAVSPGDDTRSYINKLINANQAALEYIRAELGPELIEQAVDLIDKAKRIEIFGMGGSASIAQDAQHKLFRLGTPTIAYEDGLKQRMAAAAADENTVIIFISFTGRTQAVVETAVTARKSGATLIAVTEPTSALAKACHLTINSGSELEDTTTYVPMSTRIVILTIIDILATGLALKRSPSIEPKLQRMKDSLENTKVNQDYRVDVN